MANNGNAHANAPLSLIPVPGYVPQFREDLCSIF